MNDYLSRCGKTLLIVCITVCALSIAVSLSNRPKAVYVWDAKHISNIFEIQQQLIEQGFGEPYIDDKKETLRVDGKWGRITEQAYCNWCAVKVIEGRAIEGE